MRNNNSKEEILKLVLNKLREILDEYSIRPFEFWKEASNFTQSIFGDILDTALDNPNDFKTNEIHLQKGESIKFKVDASSSPVKCILAGVNKEVKAWLRFLYCFNKLIKCETFEWTWREEPVVKEEETGVLEKEHLFYSIKSDEVENKTYLCYIKNKVTAAELDEIRARINTNKKEIDKSKTETTDIDNEDNKDQSDKGKGQKQIGKKKEEKEDSKKRIKKKPEMALRSSDESDSEENEKNKNKFNQSLVNPSKYTSSNDES